MRSDDRVALIGLGAIGKALIKGLQERRPGPTIGAVLHRRPVDAGVLPQLSHFTAIEDLLAWKPSVVIECAGHAAVQQHAAVLLENGIDVIIASIGVLGDAATAEWLEAAARAGRSHLTAISGAIGGIDALRAAKYAGLERVVYTGRKPPKAWMGTPAAERADLPALKEEAVVYEGTARDAARLFPKNANVTATVALAGIGFDRTSVRLIADPKIAVNVHELEIAGSFGRMHLKIENNPLPDNPSSSYLTALSAEQALRSHFDHLRI